MKKRLFIALLAAIACNIYAEAKSDRWPDGQKISEWFLKTTPVDINTLGKKYVITDYGVKQDSTLLQTAALQAVIDKAAKEGGGVVIVPKGTFLTGSLFFKPGTHLHLEEGGVIKGSDDISDFPVVQTRIEGRTVKYFPAVVNADSVDGFTISGKGTLNGNGLRYWKAFWLRRAWNRQCTNMDEQRPRLLYVSNSKDVQVEGIRVMNSPFWSTHYYKCKNVKVVGLRITSPAAPVKAPSTDGIDIDACENFLIKNCYISVNDDGIALKGGKGPTADKQPENGENRNILMEDCKFGFSHGVMTCGSEAIHCYNILVRNCEIDHVQRLLWLKMRPDTPQLYEYITFDNIKGNGTNFLVVAPWTQFFDLGGQKEMPKSTSRNVTMSNIDFDCDVFFNVKASDQYELSDFTLENINSKAKKPDIKADFIKNFKTKNVNVTK